MIKRILKVIMFMICFLLLGLACFTIPITTAYVIIKYILTGKADTDYITVAIDWVMYVPIDFIDEL
jgi:hypothetical protein